MATQTLARTRLETLVEGFDRDVAAGRTQIRELLARDPRSFHEGIVPMVKSSLNSRGAQFVVSLLVSSDYLMPILGDPALKLEEAISLARIALPIDPMMDVTMVRKLADETVLGVQPPNTGRLLDILGSITTGNRITSSLLRMLRTGDLQLRSKVVLLIGRSSRSVKWVQTRLAETDPRTRANAVESLWDLDTVEARELLRGTARDANNRVAGNALYALYRMGDTWIFPELVKMAAAESPMFRSSAAWVMGETDDPRFSGTLGHMVGETNAIVRKRAFSALQRLKVAARKRHACEWRVAGRLVAGPIGIHQIRFEAGPLDGNTLPALLPTQFILSLDGEPVTQYQVEARPQVEALAVTYLFPRITVSRNPPWVQGAIDSFRWKRPSDLWCATFYLPANETPQPLPNQPQFASERDAAVAALEKPPGKMDCAPFWDALRNAVQLANAPARGARNLIVYNQTSEQAPDDMPEIISAAMTSNTTVQVISLAKSPPLEELCRRTRGSFHVAQTESDLSKLIEEANLALYSRFLISCPVTSPRARELSVKAFDATGWGETTILL